MSESTPESAISPVGSASQSEVRKPPLWRRVLRLTPKEVKSPDITPAAPATDFVPSAQAIDTGIAPVNADAPEFATPSAQVDTVAKNVEADLTAQMAAHVNAIPGTARPPEMASGFASPTNPPTETVPPIVAEAGAVAPTPIRTETSVKPPTPMGSVEEPAA